MPVFSSRVRNTSMEIKRFLKKNLTKKDQLLLDESFEKLKDPSTHIAFEELDYYLDELEKLRT